MFEEDSDLLYRPAPIKAKRPPTAKQIWIAILLFAALICAMTVMLPA